MSAPLLINRSLCSSAFEREALQEGPKSRSPNSRVRDIHVTVAVRASWNHHLGVVRCRGLAQELGGIGQVVGKIDGEHRLIDHVQIWGRIIVG